MKNGSIDFCELDLASGGGRLIEGCLVPGQLTILNTYDHALTTSANSTYGSILKPLQNGIAWIWGTVKLAGSLQPSFFPILFLSIIWHFTRIIFCIFPFLSFQFFIQFAWFVCYVWDPRNFYELNCSLSVQSDFMSPIKLLWVQSKSICVSA